MRYLMVVSALFSSNLMADVFFKPLSVSDFDVISPAVIEFTIQSPEKYKNSKARMMVTEVDFEGLGMVRCEKQSNKDCQRLNDFLASAPVNIQLIKYNQSTAMFTGDILVNGDKLAHTMIKQGWYKFDYKTTRSKHLVLMQKQAMCKGLGIWQGKSTSLDTLCN